VLCAMVYAGDGPNGQVGRQAQRAELAVDEPLEFELAEGATGTGHLQRQVARLREALEGFLEGVDLLGRGIEPCAERQRLHGGERLWEGYDATVSMVCHGHGAIYPVLQVSQPESLR